MAVEGIALSMPRREGAVAAEDGGHRVVDAAEGGSRSRNYQRAFTCLHRHRRRDALHGRCLDRHLLREAGRKSRKVCDGSRSFSGKIHPTARLLQNDLKANANDQRRNAGASCE
jgi:hypothetical protein